MVTLVNRAKMSTSTTGTGTITLGSAETGYQSFADAGVANGDVVRYVIEDGDDWEIGSGTYTATGTTLTRTVDESSNADAALNLTGSAVVFITAAAGDVFQGELLAENPSSPTAPSATGANAVAIGDSATAGGEESVAIGVGADSSAARGFAFGSLATASGTNSLALGRAAESSGLISTAIGFATTAAAQSSLAMGYAAKTATGLYSTAIGRSYASGTHSFAAAITNNTSSYGATGANSIAIGQLARATQANSIAIGDTALSTTANLIALGGTTDTVQISGTYTLPTSDGTNGQVLTTDGAGAVTFADAGGGSALELYAENPSSPTANTVTGTNSAAIGSNLTVSGNSSLAAGIGGTATGYSSFAFGDGADATGNHSVAIGGGAIQASGAQSIAIGYGSDATNTDAHAFGRNANAGGNSSTALGRDAVASTTRAMALGDSYANGVDSLAAAIANNTSTYGATGSNSIAIGYRAKASGSFSSIAVGLDAVSSGRASIAMGEGAVASADSAVCFGEDSTASGANGSIIGGSLNTASGTRSAILGGYSNSATSNYSIAMGSQAKSDKYGKIAHATGAFATTGDAQGAIYVLRASTTDATPKVLATIDGQADANTQIVAASDTCITFDGTITAMQNGAQAYASWKIEGLLVNDGGTTTLANSATTVISNSSSWGMALSADNTNNALAITVTGEAAHNIRWVANIRTTEVTYA